MTAQTLEINRPDTLATARRGLACILDGPESAGRPEDAAAHSRRQNFENWFSLHGAGFMRQVVAMDGSRMISACLWTQSPGRTALFYSTNISRYPDAREAARGCIAQAAAHARTEGMVLAQTILDADNQGSAAVFREAGFRDLADLYYMDRNAPLFLPRPAPPEGISLWPYRPELEHVFATTIFATYRDTRDCPKLAGLRSMTDVMAGHKAVGEFAPALWSLVRRGEDWVGVVLLAAHVNPASLEVVYLGLIPEARGCGIGGFLMRHVLQTLVQRRLPQCILAVDQANVAALKLYKKARFRITGERSVLILPLNSPGKSGS